MRFTVGGESLDLAYEQVVAAMRDATQEPIQKHLVEIEGQVFPPKQVFATVTGRARQTFTTMEAQRVLSRLGFVCRRADQLDDGTPAWVATGSSGDFRPTLPERVAAIEAAIGTIEAAVAGLHARVSQLERS